MSHLQISFLVSCSIKFQSLDSGSFLGQIFTEPSQFLLIDVLNLLDFVFIALRLCIASYETTLLQEALGLLELLLKHTASFSEAPELPGLFLTLLYLSLDLDLSLSDDVPQITVLFGESKTSLFLLSQTLLTIPQHSLKVFYGLL